MTGLDGVRTFAAAQLWNAALAGFDAGLFLWNVTEHRYVWAAVMLALAISCVRRVLP